MRKALTIISVLLLCANLPLWLRIQPVKAVGTVYIKPDGSVDPPGTPIQKTGDNYLFTGDISASIIVQKSSIVLDGAGHLLQGSGVDEGIDLSGLTDVTVKNVVIKTFDYGIYVFSSNHTTISGNTIMNNNGGIWLKESTDNLVNGNLVKENYLDGIYIWSSSNSIIFQNNLESNTYGISPYYGSSNRIYHNNFVNNAVSVNPNEPTDTWDDGYPVGGNYWSDFQGMDTNGDGIMDTPYVIDSSNRDNYPLAQTWTAPDIALTSMLPHKSIFTPGYPLKIDLTIQNQGNKIEKLNTTLYANLTFLQKSQLTLNRSSSMTVTFAWNTQGLLEYQKYTVTAYAESIEGENDLSDNMLSCGPVTTTHLGDITGDKRVDIQDLARVSGAFGSLRINDPNDSRYGQYWHGVPNSLCPHTPNADINSDSRIDVQDLARTSSSFGWHGQS